MNPINRNILGVAVLTLAATFSTAPAWAEKAPGTQAADPVATTVARQEIEYLRRLYARATDLIGTNTPENIAEGRAIYHRIFTADAEITVTMHGEEMFRRQGPDQWVEVVMEALGSFDATQHLIGTQLVTVDSLPADGVGGQASMSSYLQAWHDNDDVVDIVLGTYYDNLRFTPGVGWQIYRMNLDQVTREVRQR